MVRALAFLCLTLVVATTALGGAAGAAIGALAAGVGAIPAGGAAKSAAEASGDVNVVTDPSKMRSNAIIFDELTRMQDNPNITCVTLTDTSGNVLSEGSAADAFNALRAIVP